MRSLALAFAAVFVGMVTCQPHDLFSDTTMGSPPLVDMASSSGPDAPAFSGPAMVPDSSMAPPMATDSSAPPMVTDTSAAPVVTDTSAAPVQTSMMPPASSAPPAGTDASSAVPITDAPSTAPPATTTDAPTTTHVPPEYYYPSLDEIIENFRGLSRSQYFDDLSDEDQLFVLELLSGGEVGKIKEVMDRAGYERLFNFVYSTPLKYFDNLMQFVLASLERERHMIEAASS